MKRREQMNALKDRPVPPCACGSGHHWKRLSTVADECEVCGIERVFECVVSYYIQGLKIILPEPRSEKEKKE